MNAIPVIHAKIICAQLINKMVVGKQQAMSLEELYWTAGILGAVVAVISLFFAFRANYAQSNKQNANVSGKNNSVHQTSNNTTGNSTDDK